MSKLVLELPFQPKFPYAWKQLRQTFMRTEKWKDKYNLSQVEVIKDAEK